MTDQQFVPLAQRYMDTIFRIAYSYLRSQADADDVTQDVLIQLYKTDTAFESDDHLKHWLIRVTVNRCKNIFRSPWRKVEDIADYENSLTFEAPDRAKFPGMFLAYDALRAGGAACAMLNAANEVAVGAFLSGRIPFGRIWQLNRDTLEAAGDQPADSVEAVFAADALARRVAEGILTRTGA